MASVKKFTHEAVLQMIRHINRQTLEPTNTDIDPARSHLNYRVSPSWKHRDDGRDISDYECYTLRLKYLYVYNRPDVKTCAGWVISAPATLPKEQHKAFFQECYRFLETRYGRDNTISAVVHNDEKQGDEYGQGHLHYIFIPVVNDEKKHKTSGKKVCANDVLTRKELRDFHPALQAHLTAAGINAAVMTGVTAAQGGNRTVADLKRDGPVIERLKIERELQEQEIKNLKLERDRLLRERYGSRERSRERGVFIGR